MSSKYYNTICELTKSGSKKTPWQTKKVIRTIEKGIIKQARAGKDYFFYDWTYYTPFFLFEDKRPSIEYNRILSNYLNSLSAEGFNVVPIGCFSIRIDWGEK